MSGIIFLRNACKSCINHRRSISEVADAIGAPMMLRTHPAHVQSRPFCRLPHFFRKTKEVDLSPSLLSSSISSSSAATSKIGFGFVGWYLGMIKSRPILTKSITSSLIYTAADLSSQTIALPSSEPYNLVRTLRMAGYGMIVLGPSVHFWFNFMSKLFPKRDMLSTLKKIAMGQTSYGPAMTVVFFSLNARLQGENGGEIVARLKRDLVPTLINGVMYWPICDFITFKFIPVHLQPLNPLDAEDRVLAYLNIGMCRAIHAYGLRRMLYAAQIPCLKKKTELKELACVLYLENYLSQSMASDVLH